MKCDKKMMRLYAVTDRSWLGDQILRMQVEEALKGGVTCVQLREKGLDEVRFLKEALVIKTLCGVYEVPFIINDNVVVAMACGADGVHVGQRDMAASDVRQIIGENMILGVSVQTVEQAREAEQGGADYLGVGAVFATGTKKDARAVSHGTVKEICDAVSIPVVAIGGIHKQNIMELAGSGIDGVAVVSAIFAADSIEEASRELCTLSEEMTR